MNNSLIHRSCYNFSNHHPNWNLFTLQILGKDSWLHTSKNEGTGVTSPTIPARKKKFKGNKKGKKENPAKSAIPMYYLKYLSNTFIFNIINLDRSILLI